MTEQTSFFFGGISQRLREKPSVKPAGGKVSQISLSQRNKAGGYKWMCGLKLSKIMTFVIASLQLETVM